MATYTDDFPFAGVAYAKYLQLLDIEPEWVEQVSNEELEDYLQSVAESYQQRYDQLVAIGLNHALAKTPRSAGRNSSPSWKGRSSYRPKKSLGTNFCTNGKASSPQGTTYPL